MSRPTLVMEYHEPLLEELEGERLVVRVDALAQAAQVAARVCRANHLVVLEVRLDRPLVAVDIPADISEVPIALYLPEMGPFREVTHLVDRLRLLNLRLFFPADRPDNYRACRILSSLGIATGLHFVEAEPDWEALCDLLTYATFGRSPHAPIEPFRFLTDSYDPGRRTSFAAVWFDECGRFLHLSREGRVALTKRHLSEGRFLAERPATLGALSEEPACQEEQEAWRRFFVEDHVCAFCPAWRVCLGHFAGVSADPDTGCRKFFLEILELAEGERRRRQERDTRRRLWQP